MNRRLSAIATRCFSYLSALPPNVAQDTSLVALRLGISHRDAFAALLVLGMEGSVLRKTDQSPGGLIWWQVHPDLCGVAPIPVLDEQVRA